MEGERRGEEIRMELLEDSINGSESSSSITAVLMISTLLALPGSLSYGLAVGYSSPVESEIMRDLGLSTEQYSVFAAALTVGGSLGAVVSGKTTDFLGRRRTFWLTDIFYIIGWLTVAASQDAWLLDLGRFLVGFSLGILAYAFMISCGISMAYLLGIIISWRILALIGVIPSLVQLIGSFFIVESPRWLIKNGQDAAFRAALQRLRGANVDIFKEASDIKEYTEVLESIPKVNFFQLFQKKYAYTLTIGMSLGALGEFCGLNGVLYYATSTFESAGLSGTVGTIALGLAGIPTVVLATILMDKCGRRPLLMISAAGLCISCMLTGFSFVLKDHHWLKGFSSYITLIGILMYSAMYSIGMGGATTLILSEIYPINIKGLAGSLASVTAWVSSSIVTYTFSFFMEWSSAGTFFILAGICAFTLVFVAKMVPETKGRSLEEVQASLCEM